ncbi:MAG TPA: HAD family hydrolase [Methylophilaceae bacterium]|jgi:phosphoglycolate phosphatase|nr:HAD family hydrolase [Methylophilaceae bacterium]
MNEHIIFDLDGTLIDSAPSIVESFIYAFASHGITPSKTITSEVVGPPLMPTLTMLTGQDEPELLQQLATKFKAHYDAEGYKKATVFPGVQALLDRLKKTDATLYIATNKRDFPTQKIMEHLNWGHYFKGIFSLDTYTPPLASKPLMVARILEDYQVDPAQAIYIGDRYEDGLAADHNHMDFVMVTWGYADQVNTQLKSSWVECLNVKALQSILVGTDLP